METRLGKGLAKLTGEVRQGAFMPDGVGMCWRHLRVIQIEEDMPFSDAD